MEGGGEGMVAVVRGTTHALTVTLISDNHGNPSRNCFDPNTNATRVSLSSVETNTEKNLGHVNVPTADIKYASSYRNIQYPDYESPYVSTIFPQPISSIFRSQDLFTQSLRKYPNEKSSAEMIQRIINYTRTKNYKKKRFSRSLRSFIRKSRSQTEVREDSGTVEECGGRFNEMVLSNEVKDLSQNELVNYTYDYLKSSSLVPRHTDVRYFTEVKKAIRGRLREIICDKPRICPWIQGRYCRHRQRYHKKSASSAKDLEIQATKKSTVAPGDASESTVVRHTASSTIINHRTRLNPCFCNRHLPRDDEIINRYEPVQNLLANLRPEENLTDRVTSQTNLSDSSGTDKETFENVINKWLKTIPVNYNLNEKEQLKREHVINNLIKALKILKQQSDFPELAKREILKCLDILPMWHSDDSENDFVLKHEIADDLVKRLVNVAEENFKMAISEKVKKLPFDSSRINDRMINKTIDKFIEKLKQVSLNNNIKDEDYKEKLKLELISLLKDLPLKPDSQKSDQIVKLADKFVKRLHQYKIYPNESKKIAADIENNEIEKKLYDWCTELITDKHNRKHYSDIVKSLAKIFQRYKSNDSKNINVQSKLQDDVKEWLDRLNSRVNTKLAPERIDFLTKDVLEKIFSSDYTPSNTFEEDAAINRILRYITDWYRKIPGLSDYDNDDIIKRIKELSLNLNNIRNRDHNFDNILSDMKDTILKWLENILDEKALQLDSKVQDNLINNLLIKLAEEPDHENDGSKNVRLYKDVVTWLKEVPLTKPDFDERNKLAGEFVVRLMDIEETSDEDINKDNVEKEIKNLVNKLSEIDEEHISPDDIEKLKLKVFTQKNITPLRRKLWNKRKSNLKKTLYGAITDIVDSCPLLSEKLKPSLKHKITDVVLRNIKSNTLDLDKTIPQVSNILKEDTTLLKNDIEMLGKQIVDKVNNVLLRHESLHISPITEELNKLKLNSETNISQETSSIETDVDTDKDSYNTPLQNNKLGSLNSKSIKPSQNTSSNETKHSNHERTYVTNVESETKDTSKKLKNIQQKPTSAFRNYETQTEGIENHSYDTKSPNNLTKNLKNYNEKENSKIDGSLGKDTSIIKNIDRAAKSFDKKIEERKLINKSQIRPASHAEYTDVDVQIDKGINTSFLEKDFSTSTPLTSSINYPSLILLSTVNNSFTNKTNDVEVPIPDTLQYLNKLEKIVANWMRHLPLLLNENDKYELIVTIANDIFDRQKYIQLSNISTTEEDELEHLKYLIYKRIQNVENRDVILDIMSNVDCLNHRILSLKAPNLIQLMQEPEIQETVDINLPDENNVETNIEVSSKKIGEWFQKLFPDFIDDLEEDKIEILARNLENLRLNNEFDSSHIKKEIFQWISSILNDIDVKKLCDLAESLKKHLCDTNLTDTILLKQDTSEFVTENLSGAIIEWIRTTQYRYKLQNEIQDYFALILANDIKHVFAQSLAGDEINEQLIHEIMRDLAKVTGETNHSAFHYAIACDLLQFLKELKLFHDLSERETVNEVNENQANQDSMHINDVQKAVVEWLSMMPVQENVAVKQTEDIVKIIADFIKDIKLQDIKKNESILKHHILEVLSRVSLKIDKQDQEAQVASLITKLKDILSQKQTLINKMTRDVELQVDINQEETPSLVYKQLLHDTVSKTLLDKLTLEEQLSFNLMKEKLADAFIDLHYTAEDDDFRNKFKNKLYKEISKFCDDYLKRSPVTTINTNKLQEDLHNLLKNVSFPSIKSQTSLIRKEQEESQLQESDFVEGERETENKTTMTTGKQDAWTQSTPQISPTSLSLEDIEHLQRIRTRSESRSKPENAEEILTSNSSIKHYEDVGLQTSLTTNDKVPKSIQTSNASVTDNVPIRREISPQVLIREYYWDSSRSNQSFQILKPTKELQQKELPIKTTITTITQTDTISDNEKKSLGRISTTQKLQETIDKANTIETETQTEDLQQKAVNKSRYILQSHLLDDIPELQNLSPQEQHNKINDTRQPISKRRERTNDGQTTTHRIFEKETIDHLETFNKDRGKFNQPKSTTISENLPPIIITEKRSERRVYASPEYITHDNRGEKICCNCKNHLLTQCRNKAYAGCRQVPTKNSLKHCSKCFGAYCPHPSYFFFKKNY